MQRIESLVVVQNNILRRRSRLRESFLHLLFERGYCMAWPWFLCAMAIQFRFEFPAVLHKTERRGLNFKGTLLLT